MAVHPSNSHRKFAVTSFAIVLLSLVATSAVQAQSPPSRGDVAFGFSSIPYLQDSSGDLPAGWIVAFTRFDDDRPFGFVFEASGSYGTNSERMYTAMGGLKVVPNRRARARPFAQVLSGIVTVGCCDETYPYFSVEPGGGVDVSLSSRVGVRVGASMPLIFAEGTAARALRAQVGIVFPF